MSKQNQQGLTFALMFIVIVGGWISLVYGLLGYADHDTQRWAATITIAVLLPGAIVLTRLISVREIKAHERGIDKGIDKVSKAAQETASIRSTLHTTIKQAPTPGSATGAPARSQWDDMLPRPTSGAAIVARSSADNTPIDL
jgi:hypothetical protein